MSDNKQLMLMVGPFSTRSGYGEHARDMFKSFYDIGKYDIKILDTRWGDTPRNALNEDNEYDKLILDSILINPHIDRQPDICVDIRIPNEFNPVGKLNIGITAGIETTAVSQPWIDGMNKMDFNIVPSVHSKSSFMNTYYDKMQTSQNGQQQKVGELKIENPIEVLFEGADTDIYKNIPVEEMDKSIYDTINDMVKEKYSFLFVGSWLKGDYGEDRKDVSKLIKVFYETFINTKNPPALILKTQGATFSIIDKESILNKINNIKSKFPSNMTLPNVYLLHGDLTSKEMNSLYNHPKIKSMVSFTHGEGFGRPLLEATMTGLPVIAPNWSGHIDFLDEEYCMLLGGKLDKIPDSVVWKDILIPESMWFNINENESSNVLQFAFKNSFDMKSRADRLMNINNKKFSHSKMTEKLKEIMNKYESNIPKPINLKLPKLKKISKVDDTQKISLPKLEKV